MNKKINQGEIGIILAMREPYLSLILSGKKNTEVRRSRPCVPALAGQKPIALYLYHRGAIHGICYSSKVRFREGAYDESGIKSLAYTYHEQACLTEKEMTDYLRGAKAPCLYFISNAFRYEHPIPVPCRPQSWQYMTPEILELLQGGKEEAWQKSLSD